MPELITYADWAQLHADTFGLNDDRSMKTIAAWESPLFCFTLLELQEATQWLATSGERIDVLALHLSLIVNRVKNRRRDSIILGQMKKRREDDAAWTAEAEKVRATFKKEHAKIVKSLEKPT